MKRCKIQLHLLGVFLILAIRVCFGLSEATDVGGSIGKLIEADWIEQDRQLSGGGETSESFDFPHENTRRHIRRGYSLAKRLRLPASDLRLEQLVRELQQFEKHLAALESSGDVTADQSIYLDVRRTVRRIAFCNPLLDFDKILFIKRMHPRGVFHMCDQYYGFNGIPGGGLFILSDPFGKNPKLTNVLCDSLVENGRLKGRNLNNGVFLSPELSYDAKNIYFAYSQGKGENLQWTPESCYHIFKVNVDGTGLVQLTDGSWDDFDPCILPNGRIVFISERRGGYLRCGRHCPTYTMYSMAPDGSDIICLSFHETHEWHPSIDNNGMIV
ncbi:MAG: TolB family protein, partial [Planctomycetota bacterium]